MLGASAASVIAAAIFVVESGVLYPAVDKAAPISDDAQRDPVALESAEEIPLQTPEVTEATEATEVTEITPSSAVAGVAGQSESGAVFDVPSNGDEFDDDAVAISPVDKPAQLPSSGDEVVAADTARGGESAEAEAADLTIAGRILNPAGDPVPDIQVTARFSGYRQTSAPVSERKGRSDAAGVYRIQGLVAGEYRIQTGPTDVYPSAIIVARAGLQSADIVLAEGHKVAVFGTVTDTAGTPLAGAEIAPTHPVGPVRTDSSGNYALSLTAQQNRGYVFRYTLTGYNEERVVLSGKEFAGLAEKRIDVELAAAGNATAVSGLVRSQYGENLPGVRIHLASSTLNTSYQAVSSGQGEFVIPGVEIGADYRLTVLPGDLYERYSANAVAIVPNNPPMDITLQSLAGGRVTGNMVDVVGNAVPNFAWMLRSSRASHKNLNVIGDDAGYFDVDTVPEGELIFVTRSHPHLQARGVTLEAGAEIHVDLVLDWGDESIEGTLVNDAGDPVAGANVSLSWSLTSGGVQSTSSRRTLADQTGSFRFTQLGPGVHTLDVSVPGYQRARVVYDVGQEFGELVVRLKPE